MVALLLGGVGFVALAMFAGAAMLAFAGDPAEDPYPN